MNNSYNFIYESARKNILPSLMKNNKSTSPIKKWLGVKNLPQSASIKFGRLFEELLNDCVEKSDEFISITSSVKKTYITPTSELTHRAKGNKDIDILFKKENVVYYRECKCNLFLDSEKSKTTASKVLQVKERLQKLYPDCTIDFAVLSMQWDGKKDYYCGVPLEHVGKFFNRLKFDITKEQYLNVGLLLGKELSENNYE